MLTQDEIKELIELYKAVEAGAELQIQHHEGHWRVAGGDHVTLIMQRLAKGIPMRGLSNACGALRIKPKSVRMYFANHLMISGLHSAMDWTDTHYIDIYDDGTITGGLIADLRTAWAARKQGLSEFDRS